MRAWELGGPPPVEHRFFGLDRRNLLPSLAVLAVAFLWGVVMPFIDSLIDADEIPSGQVLTADPVPVRITTAGDWLRGEVRLDEQQQGLDLFNGGINFKLRAGHFQGTAQELLDRIIDQRDELEFDSGTQPVTTNEGVTGVMTQVIGIDFTDSLYAFTHQGIGVEVEVSGPATIDTSHVELVNQMIASIQFPTEGGSQ